MFVPLVWFVIDQQRMNSTGMINHGQTTQGQTAQQQTNPADLNYLDLEPIEKLLKNAGTVNYFPAKQYVDTRA
jgi:hypothetical protein